jgi:hypothetical protein
MRIKIRQSRKFYRKYTYIFIFSTEYCTKVNLLDIIELKKNIGNVTKFGCNTEVLYTVSGKSIE